MTQSAQVDAFPAAALDDNKAGRLTADQRSGLGRYERSVRWDRLVFAAICGAIAALLLTATGPAPNAQYRPLAGAAFAAGAVFLVFLGLAYPDALTRDLREGRVDSIEGPIGKRHIDTNSRSASSTTYFLEVGKRRFEVHSLTYHQAPDAGWVKLYFLPRSHKVVNLERLPDKQIPQEALASPMQLAGMFIASMRSHDTEQRNEARAEAEAAMSQYKASLPAPVARPSGAAAIPLAQAILGTWSMGVMSMTFKPDGTVAGGIPGHAQQGHWSVDSSGKLHSDAMGRDQAADAWIVGDTLTISTGGEQMAFRRAG